VLKIGDFGVARHVFDNYFASTAIGTPNYFSPEICEGKVYNWRSDIWSFGCVLVRISIIFLHLFRILKL
jgi:serine/threonine protein kinase